MTAGLRVDASLDLWYAFFMSPSVPTPSRLSLLFPEHFPLSTNQLAETWASGLFVLDANVLLDLHRCPNDVAETLLSLLERQKARLFLPHQIAEEYLRNRFQAVADASAACREARGKLDELAKTAGEVIQRLRGNRMARAAQLDDLCGRFQAELEESGKKIDEQLAGPNVSRHEELTRRLDIVFDGRIGPPYPEQQLQELYREGKERYQAEIPPGYEDWKSKPAPRCYGDYVLWKQIIDCASREGKSIIFVTEDEKRDWWYVVAGKKLGARPELRRELRTRGGGELLMLTFDRFLENARTYLSETVSVEAVQAVRTPEQTPESQGQKTGLRWQKIEGPQLAKFLLGLNLAESISQNDVIRAAAAAALGQLSGSLGGPIPAGEGPLHATCQQCHRRFVSPIQVGAGSFIGPGNVTNCPLCGLATELRDFSREGPVPSGSSGSSP